MAITQTTDLSAAATTAYELALYWGFRASTVYSTPMISTVKPTNLTHAGSTVTFWKAVDVAINTTPLTEDTDVTAKAISDDSETVTITEYGDAIGYTKKAKGTDMLPLDPQVAMTNARQCADSFEALARAAVLTGTNVIYSGTGNTATNEVAAGDIIEANNVRVAVAHLRDANVPGVGGSDLYLGILHPFQALDLREETGDAAWVTSRNYQDISGINNGEMGTFGGAVWYETTRTYSANDGTTSEPVYRAHVMGAEAIAKAYSQTVSAEMPEVRISPVVDKLQRFFHIGWYWLGGFGLFRDESIQRIESATSLT